MRMGQMIKGEDMASFKGQGQMQKLLNRAAALGLAVAGVVSLAPVASATPNPPFYQYDDPNQPADGNYGPAIFLDNSAASAAQATAFFGSQANGSGAPLDPTKPFAVKVREPLTDPAAVAGFNQFPIKYVFADFEDVARVGRTRALADQVLASSRSSGAFVGNFNIYPRSGGDSTRPPTISTAAPSFGLQGNDSDFSGIRGGGPNGAGNRMANESLYAGAPDYRMPFNSQNGLGGGSNGSKAPNIRSNLFTLPIQRLTTAENGLRGRANPAVGDAAGYNTPFFRPSSGVQNIPYVSRFNNFGNPVLDSDGSAALLTAGHPYAFVQNNAVPQNGQLPSRSDFQAQVQHYRLRGADSIISFDSTSSGGSVIGYSQAQHRQDADTGWEGLSVTINGIFNRGNYAFANLTQQINSRAFGAPTDPDGTNPNTYNPRDISRAGAVWSGVFDRAGSSRRLAIVLSNLRDQQVEIDLPSIGGFVTSVDKYVVEAGRHRLLTFTLQNGKWQFNTNTFIFSSDLNRNGIGVPEPTTLSVLGIGAMGLLGRRRRATA